MRPVMLAVAILLITGSAIAQEPMRVAVTIKDHRFTPAEIDVPAARPIVLAITNLDPTPEEFDSSALKVEKVVAGNSKGEVRLRPLGPGRYPFMGEYHSDTAQGAVVAK